MKPREERVKEFMTNIDNISISKLRAACYVRRNSLPELDDMTPVISKLKEEFAEQPESWIIDDIAIEYNRIANMSSHNLQIWSKYRRNSNVDQPIAKANGDFIHVTALGIKVAIDDDIIFINDADFVSINADNGNDNEHWANVSFAAMQKIVQIKEHWDEIKRLVE